MDLVRLRDELDRRRVAVWRAQCDEWKPIPVALTPTVVRSDDWRNLVEDARKVFGAFPKLLRWLQLPDQAKMKEKVFAGLTGLEQLAGDMNPDLLWGHVTARFDLFWHHEEIKIIEVNCTIPAMQAYSDNVLRAWAASTGSKESSPSNMKQLLESLISMYRLNGGKDLNPKILILHRPGDSQMGELISLKDEWTKHSFQAELVTPDHLTRRDGNWFFEGESFDLVYRHIFAWRLQDHPIGQNLLNNRSVHIYNPVSAHYESKSFLALLSHVAAEKSLSSNVGLTLEEVSAVNRRVPWSRILGSGSFAVPFGDIEHRLSDLVIKRSVGYGGHQVLMGADWTSFESQSRLQNLIGSKDPVTFKIFADWIDARDSCLWIAQDRMSGTSRKTEVLCGDQVEEWDAWFDASVFINSRAEAGCDGGVSRIAKSPIVNIGAGGGLAPFVIA